MRWCDLRKGDTIVGHGEYVAVYVLFETKPKEGNVGLELMSGRIQRIRCDEEEIYDTAWEVIRP